MRQLGGWLLLGLGVAVQAVVQPGLASDFAELKVTEDTLALPAPEQSVVLSLGYRAAMADTIYAHLLVSYGLHFEEKRRFTHVADYLDTITELDPSFVQPYLYADTLITLQPVPPRPEDYERARQLLIRGTERLPYEQRVWFTAGQFIGYLAPPRFSDPKQKEEWKLTGAKLLARACELATLDPNIPFHCLAAATLLNRAGQREALIEMLTRTLAVNDDPEIRARALATLEQWVGQQEGDRARAREAAFESRWHESLPFASKEQALLVGPSVRSDGCAGRYAVVDPYTAEGCRRTWREYAELLTRD
jgi:hypothetical protein